MDSMPPAMTIFGVACEDGVAAHDGGLHAGAAHLVNGHGFEAFVLTGIEPGLAGRGLALTGGQAVAHDDLVGFAGCEAGFLDGGGDRDASQAHWR
jgi:hypothetical protein